MTSPKPVTDERLTAFLDALALCGNIQVAAEGAGIGKTSIYRRADNDPDFSEALEKAREQGNRVALHDMEREADRRGKEGWDEPVYQKGELAGYVRKYSDNLLMFRMKRLDPAYRDTSRDLLVQSGNVQVKIVNFGAIAPPVPAPRAIGETSQS